MKKKGVFVAVVAMLILCCSCATWVWPTFSLPWTREPHPLNRARELVAEGDSREKAIELLSAEAWYHQPCWVDEDSALDLFFYGSHSYDKATVVIVHSRSEDGDLKVIQISTYEPYMWQSHYSDYIDEEQFEYGLYERFNDVFPFLAP